MIRPTNYRFKFDQILKQFSIQFAITLVFDMIRLMTPGSFFQIAWVQWQEILKLYTVRYIIPVGRACKRRVMNTLQAALDECALCTLDNVLFELRVCSFLSYSCSWQSLWTYYFICFLYKANYFEFIRTCEIKLGGMN